MASFKDLPKLAIIVIIVAIVVLMSLAIVTLFSKTLRTDTTVTLGNYTFADNDTAKLVGTTGQYPFLQAFTSCANTSGGVLNVMNSSSYSITEGNADGGYVTVIGIAWANQTAENCSTQYLADSDGQAAADTFTNGLTIFGTFIAVIILAIIGLVVMRLFRKKEV